MRTQCLKRWLREMMEAATQALLRNDGLRGRLNNWMHESWWRLCSRINTTWACSSQTPCAVGIPKR